MKKLYSILLFVFGGLVVNAQCPVINGAMINSCGSLVNNEGINEFVVFTTTSAYKAKDYSFYYGSSSNVSNNWSNRLLGSKATTKKTSTGKFTASCNVIEVTNPETDIPANSRVVFIPAAFDTLYDVSALCINNAVYVVYIDATTSEWNQNGSMANNPSGNRYLQITVPGNTCTSVVRSYNMGWNSDTDGNFVTWTATGQATYINNGCSQIVTPVTLQNFTATPKGQDVLLNWSTASEINAAYFIIERSANDAQFQAIGTVQAVGNSSHLNAYNITDNQLEAGVYLYRLKMVDADGSFKYSNVVKVNFSASDFAIANLYPQPVNNVLNVTLSSIKAGKFQVSVFDIAGKLLLQQSNTVIRGMNLLQVNTANLSQGSYVLRIVANDGKIITSRFSK